MKGPGCGATLAGHPDLLDWTRIPVILAERGLSRGAHGPLVSGQGDCTQTYAEVAGNEALLVMDGLRAAAWRWCAELVLGHARADKVQVFAAGAGPDPFTIGACTLNRHCAKPVIQAFWAHHCHNRHQPGRAHLADK